MENDVKEDLEQARPKLELEKQKQELEKQKQELEKLTQEKEQEIKKKERIKYIYIIIIFLFMLYPILSIITYNELVKRSKQLIQKQFSKFCQIQYQI
ncbi:hypothetical protein VN1270_01140 [Helicobacter pylori]|nr:hypothetical protein VN1270_01140 [Helicobacter pylori]